ncbi:MAG: SMC-Scp complex subunit ScpB [Planctomycetes bacterium]|nr:SMC-Scp complex subunit ScpB [Planctomycetota bacterium]
MATPDDTRPDDDDPLALARVAAAQLGGEWQVDSFDEPPAESEEFGERSEEKEEPPEAASLPTPHSPPLTVPEVPPSPEQLIEAMLFVGGHPLATEVACSAVRGLTPERFQLAIDALNRRYREQWRPYSIEARADGFVLVARPAYRNLRERLFGGPRETRLSQPALDVLAVVAYRQPVGKAEIDAIRGTDSGPTLRQLIRLGLVAVQHRADATGREVRYGTAPRFLQVFGLDSLDELPRLGDAAQV